MLDKSIDNALLALRKQITRGDGDGLGHVEALLVLRGVHMPTVLPARRSCAAGRGHTRAMVMNALRDGPKLRRDIVRHVSAQRPEIPPEVAYRRVDQCLWKMKKAGIVVQDFGPDGCLWRLAP
ncbi:hypothetical protein ASD8599_00478 [Ascidiaceihabitans donghaensis]|uniref:Uncharacterized protein n=1 Tax=Ascidiaceihabitans donghaensis TaxID=1510460 RepID=A0A2R8B9N9_9RHOB|nr:hypothetical protein ASD8599_00478 [Ascidiaceihabitans donghaensis]